MDMIVKDNTKSKSIHLEIMRIIAILGVIFNHTGTNGFLLYAQRPFGSTPFWLYMFASVFCKVSVSLFFAISGALMLGRADESLKTIWGKRILKIVFILSIWSLAYYGFDVYVTNREFVWKELFIKLYSSTAKSHLWYLYLYIAYLAVLPFLKAMVKALEDKYFIYLFFIGVFFNGVLPMAECVASNGTTTMNPFLKITWIINVAVIYPCLGYYMQHRMNLNGWKQKIFVLWIFNILCIGLSCYMNYYKGIITGEVDGAKLTLFHSSFAVVNCVTVFITIRLLFEKANVCEWCKKIILSMGSCTFGIYLLHIWFLENRIFAPLLEIFKNKGTNDMIIGVLLSLIVFLASYICIFIISKIPILKKVVGF